MFTELLVWEGRGGEGGWLPPDDSQKHLCFLTVGYLIEDDVCGLNKRIRVKKKSLPVLYSSMLIAHKCN